MVVLDASITIAQFHADERTDAVSDVFRNVATTGAAAPALWKLEVANVLQLKVRKGRYTAAERDRYLDALAYLDIAIDTRPFDEARPVVFALCSRHGLTVYDAVYLELAIRRGLPLATLDQLLRLAATAEGVSLLGI